jgi:hypothetical protein
MTTSPWPDGIAFTAEQEQLYARGWPNLRVLAADHPDDRRVGEAVAELLAATDPVYRIEWPREVAARFVRAMNATTGKYAAVDLREPEVAAAVAKAGPPTADEARTGLRHALSRPGANYGWRVTDHVLLFEAFVGPAVVADALATALAELDGERSKERRLDRIALVGSLGFVLLRLDPDHRSTVRERLGAVHQRLAAVAPGEIWLTWLGTVLFGSKGASGKNVDLYLHVPDDARLVAKIAKGDKGDFMPDARLVYLGGEAVLDTWAKRWPKLDEPWQRWFLAQLGTIRSPKTVAIVTAMAKSSRVRELASRWLDEHRDYVHRHGG